MSMKLGIVVVYLVAPEDGDVLDLHLAQIERLTDIPYRIYGSANRLEPTFVERLRARSDVTIVDCPSTPLRGYEEHAFYLEHLIRFAIGDGATHVALFNVDSFPVRRGWAGEMISPLSETCVVSAVVRAENDDYKPHPSGLLFSREFWLEHRPTILLTEAERASAAFARYREEVKVIADTGIGYGFKLWSENLDWHALPRSNRREDHYIIGSIYGDLVFHLGGAARGAKVHIRERRRIDAHRNRNALSRASHRLRQLAARFVPRSIRLALRPLVRSSVTREAEQESRIAYERARARLLADPDAFFEYLRSDSDG
jgi:hypothetical protein